MVILETKEDNKSAFLKTLTKRFSKVICPPLSMLRFSLLANYKL